LFRHRAVRGIDAEKRAHSLSGLNAQDWSNLPDLALEGDQVAYLIIDALKELSSSVREALLLYRFRDMTHREIAVRMGLSTRTVERYIKDGLGHIGRRLEAVL
jgi:RNA polymerase sigma factor (sigma-70 family)